MLCEGINSAATPSALTPIKVLPDGTVVVVSAPALIQEQAALSAGASAVTTSTVLDLGAGFAYSVVGGQKAGVASTGESLVLECSSNGVDAWVAAPASHGSGLASNNSAAAVQAVLGRPMARFVRLVHSNGLSAQSGMLLRLAAWAA